MNLVETAPNIVEPLEFVCGDIRLEWDWVKPAIEFILQEQPLLTYRSEDVYARCVSGDAILMTANKAKFSIVEILTDNYTYKKTLNIWLAWVSPDHRTGSDTVSYISHFENIAREFNCYYLECSTSKPSIGRLHTSNGWKLKTQVYIRDLGETS